MGSLPLLLPPANQPGFGEALLKWKPGPVSLLTKVLNGSYFLESQSQVLAVAVSPAPLLISDSRPPALGYGLLSLFLSHQAHFNDHSLNQQMSV